MLDGAGSMSEYESAIRLAKEAVRARDLPRAMETLRDALRAASLDAELERGIRAQLLAEQLRVMSKLRWRSERPKNSESEYSNALEVELRIELESNRLKGGARSHSKLWQLIGDSAASYGRYDDACIYYEQALKLGEVVWGEGSRGIVVLRWSLVECLVAAGDSQAAVAPATTNYRLVREQTNPDPKHPALTAMSLATVLLKQGKHDRARALLQEARDRESKWGRAALVADIERRLSELPSTPPSSNGPTDPEPG